jgi:glutaredoxin
MPTLYVKTGCPFCAKALKTGEDLGITFDEKNIADDAVAEELISRGGKRQVPYLVNDEDGTEMYESDDIIEYLTQKYSDGAPVVAADSEDEADDDAEDEDEEDEDEEID